MPAGMAMKRRAQPATAMPDSGKKPGMEPITTTKELAAVCTRLAKHPFVTVDTEFLRETTYFPILCVAQMASADEAVVVDALADGHRPRAVLQADGEREGAEGLPRRAAGHRNRLASRQDHSASGVRHAGRRDGARLWRLDLLRPAGAAHHRRHARQVAPLHRLDAPAADRGAAQIRGLRRDASARRLSRRSSADIAKRKRDRMGRRGDEDPHLARDLPAWSRRTPGSG